MAGEEKNIATVSSVADWVKTQWGTDSQGFDPTGKDLAKKFNKAVLFAHMSTFASVAFRINNNSPKAHINFFESDYTHMGGAVDRATRLALLLVQKKLEKGGAPLTNDDFLEANNDSDCKCFKVTLPQNIIDDYITRNNLKLIDGFSIGYNYVLLLNNGDCVDFTADKTLLYDVVSLQTDSKYAITKSGSIYKFESTWNSYGNTTITCASTNKKTIVYSEWLKEID